MQWRSALFLKGNYLNRITFSFRVIVEVSRSLPLFLCGSLSLSCYLCLATQALQGLSTDETLRCYTLIDLGPATGIDLEGLR